MEGGVNAFLRSRAPLEIKPPRPWPPSPVMRGTLYGISVSGLVLLVLCYTLMFAGLTLQSLGLLYPILWIGGLSLLVPLGRAKFKSTGPWGWRWPFRPEVPAWVKYGSVAISVVGSAH